MMNSLRMHFVLGFVAVLAGGNSWSCIAAADEPGPPLAERVAAIEKEIQELDKWFREELRAANHDNEKVLKANQDYNEANRKLAEKLKTLIKENPASPATFNAVLVLIGQARYYLDDTQTSIVLDRHLTNPEMGRLCFLLRYRAGEPWAIRILEAAAEKHPSRAVRGQAAFALGDNYRSAGLPHYTREISEEQKAAYLAKAVQFYQRTALEYADTPTPDGKTTLGEKARHELTRIKNLPSLVVGGQAPSIEGEDLGGKPLRLEDFRGKVVLLVFWGSWCGPCMAMVPHERELFERHRDKPFALLGVNCGDTREKAQATVKDKQMAWRHWWDGDEIRGPIETDYNVPHWPRVFVIDKSGTIRGIDPEADQLDELIGKALAEI